MSLRISANLLALSGPITGGGSLAQAWSPITVTGQGIQQSIALPESGLEASDVLVFVAGVLRDQGYAINGANLTLSAPLGSHITVVRYGVGPRGEQGQQGIQGIKGDQGIQGDPGPAGRPFSILGMLDSEAQLPQHGQPGTGYVVDGILYAWLDGYWVEVGQLKGGQEDFQQDNDGGNF